MSSPRWHNLSQIELHNLLHYDPSTGLFTWRVRRSYRAEAGDEAGTEKQDGNIHIVINGRAYMANRLAWLYMHGAWPSFRLAVRDGDRTNLKWENIIPESEVHSTEESAVRARKRRKFMKALDSGAGDERLRKILTEVDPRDPSRPENGELYKRWSRANMAKVIKAPRVHMSNPMTWAERRERKRLEHTNKMTAAYAEPEDRDPSK